MFEIWFGREVKTFENLYQVIAAARFYPHWYELRVFRLPDGTEITSTVLQAAGR